MANGPQVLVSFIYLSYNNILTRQLVADEWVRFVRPCGKKPLRVSAPAGMQRSSYFLSLPMRYGVLLMANSMLLHSLISQGLFLSAPGLTARTSPSSTSRPGVTRPSGSSWRSSCARSRCWCLSLIVLRGSIGIFRPGSN
ncbi:hypothetical protein B0H13DRAFT_1616212 [Mycena leptocephala]|nr:hypothetical protein B0H13DRAFT_1616212 [Mycena leptocephala]